MKRDRDDFFEDEDEVEDEGSDAGLLDDQGSDAGSLDDQGRLAREEDSSEASEERVDRKRSQASIIREELRAEREHRARVERELQELRAEREQRARQPREETDDEFAARVALLDPEQRIDEKLARSSRLNQRQISMAAFQANDRADLAAYQAKAASDPVYRRYADKVEKLLQEARQSGGNPTRETVLKYAYGEDHLLSSKERVNTARKQGQDRIRREQARTTGGRGDVSAPQQSGRAKYAPDDRSPEAVKWRLMQPNAYI